MKTCKVGYDRIEKYSLDELVDLYVAEGIPKETALELASILCAEMKRLIWNERASWKRKRLREVNYGIAPGMFGIVQEGD